jgi:hypothetical protein
MDYAFHEAAKLLLFRVTLGDLKWRQHGLGMIQAEISENLRVHIWHPKFRTLEVSDFKPGSSFREVHDHRFDLTSAVIVGEIVDVPFHLQAWHSGHDLRGGESTSGWRKTKSWEIPHAKIQKTDGTTTPVFLTDVAIALENSRETDWPHYKPGDAYFIKRRRFHTTRAQGLTVTVVHRGNFDDRLARVLGTEEEASKSGIVPEDLNAKVLRAWAIQEANDAINNLKG